jgi:hypothetical protein
LNLFIFGGVKAVLPRSGLLEQSLPANERSSRG